VSRSHEFGDSGLDLGALRGGELVILGWGERRAEQDHSDPERDSFIPRHRCLWGLRGYFRVMAHLTTEDTEDTEEIRDPQVGLLLRNRGLVAYGLPVS
jgi:hypothetical protein